MYTQGVNNETWNLRAVCSKNYTAELHENWVIAEWNVGNFIEGKKNEFQKQPLSGVS